MDLGPETKLPALREDLQQLPGGRDALGRSTFLIFDPLRNRYFRIDRAALAVLRHWHAGETIGHLQSRLNADDVPMDARSVEGAVRFLVGNELVQVERATAIEQRLSERDRLRGSMAKRLLKNYLFIRIPLFRPDAFLRRVLPALDWLFSRWTLACLLIIGLLGIFLVIRQWDEFRGTFLHFFSWQGLGFYFLALLFVKSCHELGHAIVAKRRGCHIGAMGVAFLILFPVLYTDTTDAWRLTRRRDRLAVGAAGMLTELSLALIATFLWSFLDDGVMRSAAFFIATTSWVASVLINITPFLRFDGYYLLSDWLEEDNLQTRSFELGRWRLREFLFGLGEAIPIRLPARRRRLMIAYAWVTWVYRFFLFIGIALLVYHLAFKVLGIVLFLAEIWYFIIRPISNELQQWWRRREKMRWNRHTMATLATIIGLGIIVTIPWRSQFSAPAVLGPAEQVEVFAAEPARVGTIDVEEGMRVQPGDPLVTFVSPDLALSMRLLEAEIPRYEQELARVRSAQLRTARQFVLADRLAERRSALDGLIEREDRLAIDAPMPGIVRGLATIVPGQWVNTDQPLMAVVDWQAGRVTAFVAESDLHRVEVGARAHFRPDDGQSPVVELMVERVDTAAIEAVRYLELASTNGGPIPVRSAPEGSAEAPAPSVGHTLVPEAGYYQIALAPAGENGSEYTRRTPGMVHIEAPKQSIISRFLSRVVAILIRESGF